jgi:hypothetical protein
MDLKQTKLTKTEWNNTEVPVSDDEKRVLKLIRDGFKDVNIKNVDLDNLPDLKEKKSLEDWFK